MGSNVEGEFEAMWLTVLIEIFGVYIIPGISVGIAVTALVGMMFLCLIAADFCDHGNEPAEPHVRLVRSQKGWGEEKRIIIKSQGDSIVHRNNNNKKPPPSISDSKK
jgi:hypothetical protein